LALTLLSVLGFSLTQGEVSIHFHLGEAEEQGTDYSADDKGVPACGTDPNNEGANFCSSYQDFITSGNFLIKAQEQFCGLIHCAKKHALRCDDITAEKVGALLSGINQERGCNLTAKEIFELNDEEINTKLQQFHLEEVRKAEEQAEGEHGTDYSADDGGDCPSWLSLSGLSPKYNGVYEIQDTVAGGRKIYKKQKDDTCISWHAQYGHWWMHSCDYIGRNAGYAWLKESHKCPTFRGQTWTRAESNDHIKGAIAIKIYRYRYIKEAVPACKTDPNHEGDNFCRNYKDFITDGNFLIKAQEKFCGLHLCAKKHALGCNDMTAEKANALLSGMSQERGCTLTANDIFALNDEEINNKLQKMCNDEECQEAQAKANKDIDEAEDGFTSHLDTIETISEVAVQALESILEETNDGDDSSELLARIDNNSMLDTETQNKLKESVKIAKSPEDRIKVIENELSVKASNAEKARNQKSKMGLQFNKIKRGINVMSGTDGLGKVSTAGGSILNAVGKFQEGGAENIIAGGLDVVSAISNFLPPPASIVTGLVTDVFGAILGIEGGPSVEETIKEEFEEQRKYLDGKFENLEKAMSNQFDELTGVLKEEFKDLKAEIVNSTKAIIREIQVGELKTQMNRQMSRIKELDQKLQFIRAVEDNEHTSDAINRITAEMDTFKNVAKNEASRRTIISECRGKTEVIRIDMCMSLIYAYVHCESMGDIILTKLIALLQGSTLDSLIGGYIHVLNQRRNTAKKFLEEVLNNQQKKRKNFLAYGCLFHGHAYGWLNRKHQKKTINGLDQNKRAMIRSSENRVGAQEIDFTDEECTSADFVLTATCDDKMWVYADGDLVAKGTDWAVAKQVKVPDRTRVLAIRCKDPHDGSLGILASAPEIDLITDSSWKCSRCARKCSTQRWGAASEIRVDEKWNIFSRVRPEISMEAKWIWTTGGKSCRACSQHVICRKKLY